MSIDTRPYPKGIGVSATSENMKQYVTNTEDTCWKDCLACLLEIDPKKVPDFVKLYKDDYMNQTRKWLKKKFDKGLLYIPSRNFMETGELKFNESIGPSGYSIAYLTILNRDDASHVIICKDGAMDWDNGDGCNDEYDVLLGYFVVYDLTPKIRKIK